MSRRRQRRLVQQIFGISVAINAPRDPNIVPVHAEIALAIRERERDLAKADRLARFGSIENDVRHFAAAERFRGLLAQHPANGIEHVGFSAAVWADDGGNAFVKFEDRLIGKRFKADEFERLKMHGCSGNALGSNKHTNMGQVTRQIIPNEADGRTRCHNILGLPQFGDRAGVAGFRLAP